MDKLQNQPQKEQLHEMRNCSQSEISAIKNTRGLRAPPIDDLYLFFGAKTPLFTVPSYSNRFSISIF